MQQNRWQTKVGMIAVSSVAVGVVAGFVFGMNSAAGASAGGQTRAAAAGGIPRGYAEVDPRNPARSRQVFLGQPLSDNAVTSIRANANDFLTTMNWTNKHPFHLLAMNYRRS